MAAGECVLPGTLQESADYCTQTEQCMAFAYRPGALCCSTAALGPVLGTGRVQGFWPASPSLRDVQRACTPLPR